MEGLESGSQGYFYLSADNLYSFHLSVKKGRFWKVRLKSDFKISL